MMDTPSRQIIAASATALTVRDELGRSLELRRMNALDRLRLFKAVGPELSQNEPYLGMAMLASSVIAIDGIPVPAPTTESHLESMVLKLGDAGIAAIARGLSELNAAPLGSTTQGN